MKSDSVKKGMQTAPQRSLFNALGMTKEEIFGFLKEQYCVGDKKAQIAYEIACREKALLDRLDYGWWNTCCVPGNRSV